MDAKVFAYLSSINPIARKIARQEDDLRRYLGSKWDGYETEQRSELLDELAVGQEVRQSMMGVSRADHIEESRPASFPKLSIPSGEKIMVDFENDLRTWRDEFSGPFSWKSRSQQDLTLADLEGENLTKPPAKSRTAKTTAGGESESPTPVPGPETAPPQFTWQGENVWTRSVMEGFRTSRLSEPVLPATSPPPPSMPTQPEINRGFQASCEDLPQATTGPNCAGRPSSTSSAVLASRPSQPPPPPPPPPAPSNSTEQTGRSSKKSPIKRLTMSPTFSRSAEPSLLADADRDTQAETAFTNPALESEWGTFVGQEQSLAKPAGVAVQQDKPVEVPPKKAAPVQARLPEPPAVPKKALPRPLKLPEPEVVAPKPQRTSGATVKMTEEIEMTEPTQQRMDRGGEISDHSVESTPDHTTSLIKPSQRRRPVEEPEEVLTVAYTQQPAGDGLTQNLLDESDSSIPRTGFDFLDNW